MCEIYVHFSRDWSDVCTYTDEDMLELFHAESHGEPIKNKLNGFNVGKKTLNVTVSMWMEDLRSGILFKSELYDDPSLPNWWLDRVLKKL